MEIYGPMVSLQSNCTQQGGVAEVAVWAQEPGHHASHHQTGEGDWREVRRTCCQQIAEVIWQVV